MAASLSCTACVASPICSNAPLAVSPAPSPVVSPANGAGAAAGAGAVSATGAGAAPELNDTPTSTTSSTTASAPSAPGTPNSAANRLRRGATCAGSSVKERGGVTVGSTRSSSCTCCNSSSSRWRAGSLASRCSNCCRSVAVKSLSRYADTSAWSAGVRLFSECGLCMLIVFLHTMIHRKCQFLRLLSLPRTLPCGA